MSTLTAPVRCPCAYSPGVRTSTTTVPAFIAAGAVDGVEQAASPKVAASTG